MSMRQPAHGNRTNGRVRIGIALALAVVLGVLAFEYKLTAPVRGASRCYVELIAAANRQDMNAVRARCTERYLSEHPPRPAEQGGVVGLPRSAHQNYQAWREGENVLLCPTNRVGPVYQFVNIDGRWRFDGPIGILLPGGRLERGTDGLVEAE